MGVTNYLTVNGQLVGETGPNGTMYYHTDALGSVTMTTDENSNVLNTYRFKPFGTTLSKVGTSPDPKFTWVGSRGFRTTGESHSEFYGRARHYGAAEGMWTSVDSYWPDQNAYEYGYSSPASLVDPSGYAPCSSCCCTGTTLALFLAFPMLGVKLSLDPNNPNLFWGHHIYILFATSAVSSKTLSDCKLKWYECSNFALASGPPGQWNAAPVDSPDIAGLEQWRARHFDCDAHRNTGGFIQDEPSVTEERMIEARKPTKSSITRILYMDMWIQGGAQSDGKGCGDSEHMILTQTITYNINTGMSVKLYNEYVPSGICLNPP